MLRIKTEKGQGETWRELNFLMVNKRKQKVYEKKEQECLDIKER